MRNICQVEMKKGQETLETENDRQSRENDGPRRRRVHGDDALAPLYGTEDHAEAGKQKSQDQLERPDAEIPQQVGVYDPFE